MLLIPAIVPSTLSAYSVVREREQGTLEPVLLTPIRREEFFVEKALAVAAPTLIVAYTVFGIFLAATAPARQSEHRPDELQRDHAVDRERLLTGTRT